MRLRTSALELGILIGHVLLQPAIDAGRLDAQGEGEDGHDPSALLDRPSVVRRFPARGLQDERVAVLARLHLGDSREIALENRVSQFFERIDRAASSAVFTGVAACSSR